MKPTGEYKGQKANPDTGKKVVEFQGINIKLDRPKGFIMRGEDDKGVPWTRKYKVNYGFIPKTEGGDGDGLDVFLGPDRKAPEAYWAVQTKPDGSFDEYKVFLGFTSRDAAIGCYRDHIPKKLLKSMLTFRVQMMKALLGLDSDGLIRKTAALVTISCLDELAQIQGAQ